MLKTLFHFFIGFLCFGFLEACSAESDGNAFSDTFSDGEYEFVMYDSLNTRLIGGKLTFRTNDTVHTAEIDIEHEYKDFYSHGNMKSGKNYMHYNKNSGIIFINMNPSSTDDNVFITLTATGGKLTGTWTHSTIAGEMGKGTFTAKKIKK